MRKVSAERKREIDFTGARRGAVVPTGPGKTKISIRLDHAVLEHFRRAAEAAGGGSYQTMINSALNDWIEREAMLGSVRRVVREELARYQVAPRGRRGRT